MGLKHSGLISNLIKEFVNEKSIKWCNENIQNIRFIKNELEPPLSIENEQFDCVYAISIFTHLSEKMHYAWISELFRVLKPNGILIFTTHGDICAERLLPEDKALYDSGSLVVKAKVEEGKKHFASYHPRQFVKNTLLKDYVIFKHIGNPAPYLLEQEIWVLKNIAKNNSPPVVELIYRSHEIPGNLRLMSRSHFFCILHSINLQNYAFFYKHFITILIIVTHSKTIWEFIMELYRNGAGYRCYSLPSCTK